eukprot:XP_019073383.1 PREDICTED: putative RING-H2 finger protein ATL21A [Vitis vinifera]
MGISLFFFFLFMGLFAEINGRSQDEECKASRCSHHGPVIRFPFRLKHQSDHCGYPEFELSCSENKQTILEPPYSLKLSVEKINYTSQEIIGRPDYCHRRKFQNFNLSASPFQFTESYLRSFSFFSCSENKAKSYGLKSIPCSFLSSDPVYAIESSSSLDFTNLSFCRKQKERSVSGRRVIAQNPKSNALINQQKPCGYLWKIHLLPLPTAPSPLPSLGAAVLEKSHSGEVVLLASQWFSSRPRMVPLHPLTFQKMMPFLSLNPLPSSPLKTSPLHHRISPFMP